jgi:hypothetical protein
MKKYTRKNFTIGVRPCVNEYFRQKGHKYEYDLLFRENETDEWGLAATCYSKKAAQAELKDTMALFNGEDA